MKKTNLTITRRDFIRGTMGVAIGTSILGLNWPMAETNAATPSLVTVVRDKNALDTYKNVNIQILKEMLEQALINHTGQKNSKKSWLSLVNPDDVIGLVPTDWLYPTHDEVVDVVKSSLMNAGFSQDKIRLAQGSPDSAKECDSLIAIPSLKSHWLTGIGTVLKLYIMYSGNPSNYHQSNSARLGEIWNLPFVKGKTKLVLVDSLYPLCNKGPQADPRYQWAYKGLIAGTDPVAVETVCLNIINKKREAIKGKIWPLSPPPICVEAADKVYGLGTSRIKEIKIENFGWEHDLLL